MPRIKPVDIDSVDSRTAASLQAVKKKLGVLPNIFPTFAQSPAALNSYLQSGDALAAGRLTARQRELVALAIAQENSCHYCLSAHAAIGKMAGLNSDDIALARNGGASDPLDDAIVDFALKIVRSRGGISDEAWTRARENGVDEGLAVEIVANVALNVLTNYLNRVAATEEDFPPVDVPVAA